MSCPVDYTTVQSLENIGTFDAMGELEIRESGVVGKDGCKWRVFNVLSHGSWLPCPLFSQWTGLTA